MCAVAHPAESFALFWGAWGGAFAAVFGMTAFDVTFWGTRGSVPVAGPATAVYGGNTPCVEIRAGAQRFVLDAGTGIVPLGRRLKEEGVAKVTLLLSHLHHDHIGGLPFFAPLFDPAVEVEVLFGNLGGKSAQDSLDQVFRPPFFPLPLSGMAPRIRHRGFAAGETLVFGDVVIRTMALNHPGGSTAFRFERAGASVTYATDVEHLAVEPDSAMVRFVAGSDLLIYDTMLTDEEATACAGWGHSTAAGGEALAVAAGVRRLAGFHHNPAHDDAMLSRLEAALQARLPGAFHAREGQTVTIDDQTAMLSMSRTLGRRAATSKR